MYREISKLILYSDLGNDCILTSLAETYRSWESKSEAPDVLIGKIYKDVKRLLDLATTYGFNNNLWQCYLTWLIITNENSFSLTCEGIGAGSGSVNRFAKADFEIFRRLFNFDFSAIEKDLGIDCFSILTDYHAIPKRAQLYYRNVSERVLYLSSAIAKAENADEVFDLITGHYRDYGTGMFGMNRAFRVQRSNGKTEFVAINNVDTVMLSDLTGYEIQKRQLRDNIEAFINRKPYNNTLLYGDAGTGKSTSVKAVLNEYFGRGLRMIEIYKHQFDLLSDVIASVKNRNYRFIIFIDDLSFDDHEVQYKFLKAVIEGGVETRPDNIMICATSNRRHLVQETWNDRNDMQFNGDVHHSDTMEEKLSLAARFGCAINYSAPDHKLYHEIVRGILDRYGTDFGMTEEQLNLEANKWELRHGGVSGRTAQQFVNYLIGQKDLK